jgi:hypothetical protein
VKKLTSKCSLPHSKKFKVKLWKTIAHCKNLQTFHFMPQTPNYSLDDHNTRQLFQHCLVKLDLKHFSCHIGKEIEDEHWLSESFGNNKILRYLSISFNDFGHIPRILYSTPLLNVFNRIEILELTGKCKIISLFAEKQKIYEIVSSLPITGYFKARMLFKCNVVHDFHSSVDDIFLILTFWLSISHKARRLIKLRLIFEKLTETHTAVISDSLRVLFLNPNLDGLSHEIVNNRTILASASAKVDLSISGDADKNLLTVIYPSYY